MAVVVLFACTAEAQTEPPINIYRYTLGIDVPESAALVPMGASPTNVLKGSSPKPVAVNLLVPLGRPGDVRAAALDIAPYFLVGGGMRRLESYRSNSLAGRLTRVLTKTVVSVGAAAWTGGGDSARLGIAVRSTFHDPHDPVLNTRLPEEVAAALARHGARNPDPSDEDVTDRGVDLSPVYAEARRAARARAGDPQISGGWGMSAVARGAELVPDSVDRFRHTFWLSGQMALNGRFDVLVTLTFRDALDSLRRSSVGAALLRKSTMADIHVELSYDTKSRTVHPGLAIDARATTNLGIVTSITTQTDTDAITPSGRRLRVRLLARWFAASDRPTP